MTDRTPSRGKVIFVGAGPGAPDLITVRGQRIIAQADLIVYAGSLVPRAVLEGARPEARLVDSAPLTLKETHRIMAEAAHAGLMVARVHTGDPSLYGTVPEQARLLDAEGIPWEVVPGVSAAFAAAAAAKVSFTLPEGPQSLILTRLPGRTPVPAEEDLTLLARSRAAMAVYLSAPKAEKLAQKLSRAGLPPETPVVVAARVGHPEEEIRHTTLHDLAADARGLTRQAVFLVLPGHEVPHPASRLYDPTFAHGFRRGAAGKPPSPVAIYTFCPQGMQIAQRLSAALPATIFAPSRLAGHGMQHITRLAETMAHTWNAFAGHVFVGAAGIAVRAVAPHLRGKTQDPAVVVCDVSGRFVVSLVSGHLGGANALASVAARILGATEVITTASETTGTPALDLLARASGLAIGNPEALARLQGAWLEGERLALWDPAGWLRLPENARSLVIPADAPEAAAIWVGPETTAASALRLHPPCLAIGVGCRRGVPGSHILTAINATLDAHGLSPKAAALVCSIDAKAQEPGLHEAARSLGVPFRCFPPDVLSAQPAPHPSARVYQHMGVSSVCEAAALASHPQAELRIPKTIHGPVTVAVAQLPCGWWDSDLETQAFCPPSPETP